MGWPGGGGGRRAADSIAMGRRLQRRVPLSAAMVFGFIFLTEAVILIYMKATLVPTPTSAISAFTSSSPGSTAAGAAAGASDQPPPDARELRPQLVAPLSIALVSMGRPTSEQQSARSGAMAAARLAQALLELLEPEGEDEEEKEEGSAPRSRAYVVSAEDVMQEAEAVATADLLMVVHEAPYDVVCGEAAQSGASNDDAVADCRQGAQQASVLQSGLALDHDGDMVLHVDGSALHSMAGAVMVAEGLLERWGVDTGAVNVKTAVGSVLQEPISTDRRCVDAVDADAVCRAWFDFYHGVFPAVGPPVVDDDDVSAWLPAVLEAVASAEGEAAASPEAAPDTALEEEAQQPQAQPQVQPQPMRANADQQRESESESEEADDGDDLPELFYCLPGGGLNDITVEWWHCIEWAIQTGRTLVMGFENYLAAVAPYTPYFELQALPGLKTMSPAEAARRIRQARKRGKVTVFPRRLQRDPDPILMPVADSEEERDAILAGERPWRFQWDYLHHLGFEFEKDYGQQVVVFHRKGNNGSGQKTLQSLRLSEEIKRTFLKRWDSLHRPYIGLHIRSTDKSCPEAVMQRTLKRTRRLKLRPELAEARQVYLASDNPEVPHNFKRVIEEKQGREIVSFTFHPKPKQVEEGAAALAPNTRREALERNEYIRQKRAEFKRKGIMPLHLADYLSPEEKHRTNVDAFVDLLLLAMSSRMINSCGGYSRLALGLHQNKPTVLSMIGELPAGHDVNDNDLDVDAVLEAAVQRMREQGEGGLREEQ